MQLGTRDDAGSVRQIGDSSLLSGARTKAPEMDIMIVQERIPIPLHYMVDITQHGGHGGQFPTRSGFYMFFTCWLPIGWHVSYYLYLLLTLTTPPRTASASRWNAFPILGFFPASVVAPGTVAVVSLYGRLGWCAPCVRSIRSGKGKCSHRVKPGSKWWSFLWQALDPTDFGRKSPWLICVDVILPWRICWFPPWENDSL